MERGLYREEMTISKSTASSRDQRKVTTKQWTTIYTLYTGIYLYAVMN